MSPVSAARQAGSRASGAVLASDAFFPKADGVEAAVRAGVRAIVQPGGSQGDADVIAAADDWMAQHPVGSGVPAKSDAWQDNAWLHDTLEDYNSGLLCAPPSDP